MNTLGTGAAQLNILFQIGSYRTIIFDFGIDVSSWTFELFIKQNKGARTKNVTLTLGSGLSFVVYSSDQLMATFSTTNTALEEGEYYWELRRTDVVTPIVCGSAYFSYDAPQGTDQTQSLSFINSSSTVNISVYSLITITDATISFSDITTNNVSITKHGFAPKAPNDSNKYLDGTGSYSTTLDQSTVAIVAGTPNTYTLNFNSLKQRSFIGGSAASGLASDFTIQLSNNSAAIVFDWVFFLPASTTRSITCPSSFKFLQSESKFTNGTGVLAITTGGAIEKYEMSGTFDGSKWACKLAGPYYA